MLEKVEGWLTLEGHYLLERTRAKYYIIYRTAGGAGFFSNYMWVLGHIIFARRLGYIPVVDMENYPTLYSEDRAVGGETNAWNYYFDNVDNVSLKEAYKHGNYVMGKDMPLHKYAEKYCEKEYRFPSRKAVSYYAPIIEKNIIIKEDLRKEFNAEWEQKKLKGGQVLGIHIRGTDMKNDLGHPVPASAQTYLDAASKFLKNHQDIRRIFLATDENDVKAVFEAVFGDEILFMNDAFRVWDTDSAKKIGIHEMEVKDARPLHKYLLGKEVLRDAWFLSKCDYLICGHSNITNTAILWNHNKYKQILCV